MKRIVGRSLIVGLTMLFMMGCAAQGPKKIMSEFSPQTFNAADYTAKVDRFLIVFDASSSMGEYCNGLEKFTVAKEIAIRMNQTLPELDMDAGIRTFGHHAKLCKKLTKLMYGLDAYATAGFAEGLDKITIPGGTTPLTAALDGIAMDLEGAQGKTAVILLSDAKDVPANPVMTKVKALKETFGSSLCIYPILVGKDADGEALMKEIADTSGCGSFTYADNIMNSAGMADFVEMVFLKKKPVYAPTPMDSDGDGVTDDKDKCPDTPRGVAVDKDGCPLDTDGDGVYDYLDKCPGTPVGAKVNAQGCWILSDLLFDFDQAVIKPEGFGELANVIDILEKNPAMNVVLQGHTDSIGTKAYNKKLSMKRAKAVMVYLINKGVSASRLSCDAFGESKPVTSNKTKQGRALNRRVELMPVFK